MKPFWLIIINLLCVVNVTHASQLDIIKGHITKGQLSKALSLTERELSSDPNNAEVNFIKAVILEKNGDYEQARSIYETLTITHPGMPEPHNNLAIYHSNSGNIDLAIQSLESALKTHPSYATAYLNLVSLYNQLASQSYRIALNSETPVVYPELASILDTPPILPSVSPVGDSKPVIASTDNGTSSELSTSSGIIDTTQPETADNETTDTDLVLAASDTSTTEPIEVSKPYTEDTNVKTTSTADVVAVSEIDTQSEDTNGQIEEASTSESSVSIPTANEDNEDEQLASKEELVEEVADESSSADVISENQLLQQQKNEIIKQLQHWATSWSDQSVEEYLKHYSDQFLPQGNTTLVEWKKQRKSRLLLRDFIEVNISQFSVEIDGDSATVNFTQQYKSNIFEDTVRKTVQLRLSGEQWLIYREQI